MGLIFDKYQGAGNDFIIVNNLAGDVKLGANEIEHLCNRRYGIGADGLIILEKSLGYDYAMQFYNSDGRTASMCGNGGRCIAKYAFDNNIAGKKQHFLAADGEHFAEILDGRVRLQMIDVERIFTYKDGFFVNTGVPHFVKFVSDLSEIDVEKLGRFIADDERFRPERTNVDFCDRNGIFRIATYERGVEGETLACGTGAVATALCINLALNNASPITLQAKGGELKIYFETKGKSYINIWLEGPAEKVFKGEINGRY